jgi:hypothetical protein
MHWRIHDVPRQWLNGGEIAGFLDPHSGDLCDLILELRELVQEVAPEVHEAIKFNALCYYKPGHPYGVIGGNMCMIGARDDCVHLSFIHGAFLPDPGGLLEGSGKAKRHIEIRSAADIRRAAFAKLIRAAVAYSPTEDAGL